MAGRAAHSLFLVSRVLSTVVLLPLCEFLRKKVPLSSAADDCESSSEELQLDPGSVERFSTVTWQKIVCMNQVSRYRSSTI